MTFMDLFFTSSNVFTVVYHCKLEGPTNFTHLIANEQWNSRKRLGLFVCLRYEI